MNLTEEEVQWSLVKISRTQRLEATDWVLFRAQDTGVPVSEDWRIYRQALRDITTQPDPFNIQWPVMPGVG